MATSVAMRRMCVAGAGMDMMGQSQVVQEVIRLSGKATPVVLYLGTATYDDTVRGQAQCSGFEAVGCPICPLKVAVGDPGFAAVADAFAKADVVLVSGGNTLYAADRWRKLGMDALMREAMERGVVFTGGSAGAIAVFDAGHSDSRDPATFKNPDPSISEEKARDWKYMRVPSLNMLPGLVCPHHDKIQSNGMLRALDFDEMLLRHSGETGIGIDHFAALCVEGEDYHILALDGKEGSVAADGSFSAERLGRPGIWLKKVVDGVVQLSSVPEAGKLADILMPAAEMVDDALIEEARAENPDDGKPTTAGTDNV